MFHKSADSYFYEVNGNTNPLTLLLCAVKFFKALVNSFSSFSISLLRSRFHYSTDKTSAYILLRRL